jgi:murein DD-endopeptidase MepM/ murein hydrolase activator NlpD
MLEPILEATGIPDLFPMTLRDAHGVRTIVVNRRRDRKFVVITQRPQDVRAPDDPAVVGSVAADVAEHVLPLIPRAAAGGAEVRWVVDHFYAFEAGGAAYLTYATFDRELRRLGMTFGPGFGAAERRLAQRPVVLDIAPAVGRYAFHAAGDSIVTNAHFVTRDMRYAVDMVALDDESRGVVSPVDGTVLDADDGRDDDLPRDHPLRNAHPYGNYVRLEAGGLWYWFLHLRKGTVAVRPGERVRAGARLGDVGDSGRSAEPHLHFHVSTAEDVSHGVPLRLRIGGRAVEPRRGLSILQRG